MIKLIKIQINVSILILKFTNSKYYKNKKQGEMFSKKNLKREDFIFQNGWFQNKLKKPKEMHMQQFQISDCEECNIYILDSSACVYIDQCKYCNIFIGPCQSSVFIRDCQGLTVVSISQQFRVRDTFKSRFAIFCQSQPIIQSSCDITFSCIPRQFGYKQLNGQLKQAKLNLWNNNWFDIYDFTPAKFNTNNHKQLDFEQWSDKKSKINLFQAILKQNLIYQEAQTLPKCLGKFKQNKSAWEFAQIAILVIFPLPFSDQFKGKPVLHFRCQIVPNQLYNMLQDFQYPQKQKLLFVKISKKDQQKFKQVRNTKKFIKTADIQLLQTYVFTPFKDEH